MPIDPEEMMSLITDKFGEGEGEAYQALMKGLAALITTATIYNLSPEGSGIEKQAADQYEQMLDTLIARPQKARDVVQAALALIVHMDNGGTMKQWFEPAGVQPIEVAK